VEQESSQIFSRLEVCLLAGKIMLQSGAETARVEDTMMRIASFCGFNESHCFVAPTVIVFSMVGTEPAKVIRISERSTDLHKVTLVNDISRKICSDELSMQDAYSKLKQVDTMDLAYPIHIQVAAAALVSACFLIMFQGRWFDFVPALLCGGVGFYCLVYLHRFVQIKFFAEFLASFIIGLLAFLLVTVGLGHDLDKIIIGSVMPLVPGLLITNAVRDLMAGHLLSGISKGAEALLAAFAIGTGIAIVFLFH
jgi:uncharacterized membrane protein YjjP (DUF1212 family)